MTVSPEIWIKPPMRILFLTAQLPEPAHAGGTLRTNGLMRGVHAAGHEVHLLSIGEPAQLAVNRAALDEFCASVEIVPLPHRKIQHRLRDLLVTNLADMQRRCDSPHFAVQLERTLAAQRFDVIQIESLEMATYLPTIQRALPGTPIVYDSFNAEFDLQRTIYEAERYSPRRLPAALYSLVQWRRLTRFERSVCESVDHIIAVSDADADAFARLAPGRPVSIVPNGIDAAPYAQSDTTLDLGRYALVFTGSMGYRPNVDAALWFADQILPRVRARIPEAKFFVVGSQPHPRINAIRQREDVEVTGWVPDVNPFLHAAAVYVVPLRMGSGTRLKLLQAMAAGQAAVSTSVGAQGLDVQDGVQLRLADTAEDFARVLIELLEDPVQRRKLGENGAQYVHTYHGWPVIVPKLLNVYDRIVCSSSSASQKDSAYGQEKVSPA
jgi:glycosyltransferase involved in cell wall biosynthesis